MADFDADEEWQPPTEAEWQPPTETEMKVFQARRERSDKISQLMGHYLLTGYKMLATCCQVCDTILLQTKQGVDYCVACSELDSDNVKDDPALSAEAALRQAAEHTQKSNDATPDDQDTMSPFSFSSGLARDSTMAAASTESTSMEASGDRSIPGASSLPPDITRHVPKAALRSTESIPIQESRRSTKPKTSASESASQRCTEADHTVHHKIVKEHALHTIYTKIQTASKELKRTPDISQSVELCSLIKHCAEAIEALQKI